MILLKGRREEKEVESKIGLTILDHALKNKVYWGFSCQRGTCGRCFAYIEEGMNHLSEMTDKEFDRLEPEEIEDGCRLGCQAKVVGDGTIVANNRPHY